MAEKTMVAPKTILIAEDAETDRRLLKLILSSAGYRVLEASDGEGALKIAREEKPDLLITDILMPRMDGYELVRRLMAGPLGDSTRVIFYTATYDGSGARRLAEKAGVFVLLRKPSEPQVILKTVSTVLETPLRKTVQTAPAEEFERSHVRLLSDKLMEVSSERDMARRRFEEYHSLIDRALYGVFRSSREGRFLAVNPAMAQILGYDSKEELLSLSIPTDVYVDPQDRADVLRMLSEDGEVKAGEVTWKRKDGSLIVVRFSGRALRDEKGDVREFEAIVEDVSQQRELELKLQQSQRLEAVGRLAGGVAHDFNNHLGIILGHSDLLLERLAPGDPRSKHALVIKNTALRAASLTRQLLAFSRKQMLQPERLNLNSVVSDMQKMLRPLLGERIQLEASLDPALGEVEVDPAQIEQVLMNLVVNARDAMPDGGRIGIKTENVELDKFYTKTHSVVMPGPYVMVAVSDSGTGMDDETKNRLFEPFFSTKGASGTGLGLSTAYGIVKQSGGYIWVYSELGHGTTFKVYLPRVGSAARADAQVEEIASDVPRGSETVLVVEDEELLRNALCVFLEGNGYKVYEASNGEEAVARAAAVGEPLDLLITDAVMPGMNGRQLAELLQAARPAMKVLYISGYTDDTILRQGLVSSGNDFLQKPFTKEVLLRKVSEVLHS